jgi:hypothetical protein
MGYVVNDASTYLKLHSFTSNIRAVKWPHIRTSASGTSLFFSTIPVPRSIRFETRSSAMRRRSVEDASRPDLLKMATQDNASALKFHAKCTGSRAALNSNRKRSAAAERVGNLGFRAISGEAVDLDLCARAAFPNVVASRACRVVAIQRLPGAECSATPRA